jgi:Na+(H+)/acetate symporter ActP
VNRSRFLAGGAAAVLLPTTLVPLARGDVSEGDVAYANFAIACEYLMADYYARLLKAELVHGSVRSGATVARRNEGEHVKAFAELLTDAGQSAPVAEDFAFAWPAKTFRSLGAAAEAGATIESAVLGAYISAAVSISAESYRSLFARALADEARHLAVLTSVASGKPVGNSFPPALGLEEATNVVEPYLG